MHDALESRFLSLKKWGQVLIGWLTQIDQGLKGLLKIQIIKTNCFKYMFIDSGRVISTWGKEPPVMTTREEFKTEAAWEEWG